MQNTILRGGKDQDGGMKPETETTNTTRACVDRWRHPHTEAHTSGMERNEKGRRIERATREPMRQTPQHT
eukprot:9083081-Pyramimonas_sp.AAC.1